MIEIVRNYLGLRRYQNEPIIICTLDGEGHPVLDESRIVILSFKPMNRRDKKAPYLVQFDSLNKFAIYRYKVLEKYSDLSELKVLVDRKLSKLTKLESVVEGH